MSGDTRTYAITGDGCEHLLEEVTFQYNGLPIGKAHPPGLEDVFDRAVAHAKRLGSEVDIRAHNQWWAASYTAYPDGSVYFHATGSRRGWVRSPEAATV